MADETKPKQKMLIVILDQPALVDELITGFLDIGVRGATVIESRGMGQIIRQDMPIFAGLATLFPQSSGSRMVISVMPETLVDATFELVEEIVGSIDKPNSAVCFTLPVEEFRGFRH